MKTSAIVAAFIGLGLAACSDNAAAPRSSSDDAGALAETPSSGPSAPGPVDEALRCWGLTQGAAIFWRAAPEMAGDLPQVSIEQYTAWFNEALRRASAADISFNEFQALQADYQMSNRFARQAELRTESIGPINTCLANLPTDTSEPPQLRQD